MSVALVTGASRGIGAATARRLAAGGHDVAVSYHSDASAAADVVAAGLVVQVEAALGAVDILIAMPPAPEALDQLARRIPVGRLGDAEEVADLISAVVRNGYVTNQSILIDGGGAGSPSGLPARW